MCERNSHECEKEIYLPRDNAVYKERKKNCFIYN